MSTIVSDKERAAFDKLVKAARAAIAYDDAIHQCANSPERMASFCTAQGDDLDTLYANWIDAAREALEFVKENYEKQTNQTTPDRRTEEAARGY